MLQERVLGRSDITIASAFNSNNAERLAQADAERRPVFLAFVFAPRGNLKVGVRGIAQGRAPRFWRSRPPMVSVVSVLRCERRSDLGR